MPPYLDGQPWKTAHYRGSRTNERASERATEWGKELSHFKHTVDNISNIFFFPHPTNLSEISREHWAIVQYC